MKTSSMLRAVTLGLLFSAFLTNAHAQYCTPTSEEACSDGDEINTFILNGENSTSIINNNTGCAPNGYDNRVGESVDLAPGMSYTANISSSYSYIDPDFPEDSDGDYCAIWIDFNDDQAFSLNEMVAVHNDFLSESGSNVNIAIPSDALAGEHRMRVMVAYPYFEDSFEPESAADFDPCNQGTNVWDYGEVHDYTVNITGTVTPIDSVVVIVENNGSPIINTAGGTLQMAATVYPTILSQNVIWSIVAVDGNATISANGLVTAASDGDVWAKAASVTNPAIADSVLISIYGQSTHIGDIATSIGYQLFPNPVKGMLNIQIQQEHPALNIMIADVFGKKMTELTFNKNALQSAKTIDVNHLPAGLYFIHITGGHLNITDKFIKQ